jgi:hypothetical protein
MCAKILETSGKLNMDEYNFFLRGGVVSWWEGTSLHGGHMGMAAGVWRRPSQREGRIEGSPET